MSALQNAAALTLITIADRAGASDMRAAALEGLGHLGGTTAQGYLKRIIFERGEEFGPALVNVAIVAYGRAHKDA